jgi:hypothetical protein
MKREFEVKAGKTDEKLHPGLPSKILSGRQKSS